VHSPSDFATSSYRDNETETEGQGHYAMVRQMTQGQVESFFAARMHFTESTARDPVFISYSHKDNQWRDDLEIRLKPYLRAGSFKSWSDKQISPGSQWFTEIKNALTKAKVAVLLVTPDFLASDFIHEHELGPLLKEAERGGVKILWVPVYAGAYKKTALTKYQPVIDPEEPLANMKRAKRDQAWVRICEEIEKAVNSGDNKPLTEVKPLRPDQQAGVTPWELGQRETERPEDEPPQRERQKRLEHEPQLPPPGSLRPALLWTGGIGLVLLVVFFFGVA
jgi:hypothetical protein